MAVKSKDYDVIVIGGGPGGSTAGFLLRSLGHDVLIIDKQNFPRDKLCGGITTYKNMKLLKRVFNENEEDLINKGIIDFRSYCYEFRYKKRTLFKHSFDIPLYFVDRIKYDDYFLRRAEENGAKLLLGDKVVEWNKDDNSVSTLSGKKFKGRFIVAADGVNSVIRKSYPGSLFNLRRWNRNLGTSFEIFVNRDDIAAGNEIKDIDYPLIYLGPVDWGFAWIFPRKDRLAIGIGGLVERSRGKLRKAFADFLKEIRIENIEKYKFKVHNIPLGGYVTKPVYNNAVLIGDAAGFVDPSLGEGIFYAQRTAELAAWSIHRHASEGRSLEKVFSKLMGKYVFPEFANAKFMRYLGFNFSANLGHYPVQGWMNLLKKQHEEMLHGIRTNRGLTKRNVHEKVTLGPIADFFTRPAKKG